MLLFVKKFLMLQIILHCLLIVKYSYSRNYLIETLEEEFMGMQPTNNFPSESLNNRWSLRSQKLYCFFLIIRIRIEAQCDCNEDVDCNPR